MPGDPLPRLYCELAAWWPLLSPPEDSAAEAALARDRLAHACGTQIRTLLDLGSGGGNNASHLKRHFCLTLVDRSAEMLAVSRTLNPECEHLEGDMRHLRLGRLFDAVLVHDAVDYMTGEDDLRRVMETAFVHCRAGGAALFVPDCLRDTFVAKTECGGHDGTERAARFLAWTWDPDPANTTFVMDFAYLLREADGEPRLEAERHVCGLFARADWLRLLGEVGFVPRSLSFGAEPGAREAFLGIRP